MTLLKTIFAIAVVSQVACIPVPIPREVTLNPTIRAQVIDERTGDPLEGIRVSFGRPHAVAETTTDRDGRFVIEEQRGWHLWQMILLVPFDPACALTPVELEGTSSAGDIYRPTAIATRSCSPGRLLGDTGASDRGMIDDLGVIPMKAFPGVRSPLGGEASSSEAH